MPPKKKSKNSADKVEESKNSNEPVNDADLPPRGSFASKNMVQRKKENDVKEMQRKKEQEQKQEQEQELKEVMDTTPAGGRGRGRGRGGQGQGQGRGRGQRQERGRERGETTQQTKPPPAPTEPSPEPSPNPDPEESFLPLFDTFSDGEVEAGQTSEENENTNSADRANGESSSIKMPSDQTDFDEFVSIMCNSPLQSLPERPMEVFDPSHVYCEASQPLIPQQTVSQPLLAPTLPLPLSSSAPVSSLPTPSSTTLPPTCFAPRYGTPSPPQQSTKPVYSSSARSYRLPPFDMFHLGASLSVSSLSPNTVSISSVAPIPTAPAKPAVPAVPAVPAGASFAFPSVSSNSGTKLNVVSPASLPESSPSQTDIRHAVNVPVLWSTVRFSSGASTRYVRLPLPSTQLIAHPAPSLSAQPTFQLSAQPAALPPVPPPCLPQSQQPAPQLPGLYHKGVRVQVVQGKYSGQYGVVKAEARQGSKGAVIPGMWKVLLDDMDVTVREPEEFLRLH